MLNAAVHFAALWLVSLWLLVTVLVIAVYRRDLRRMWREPVFLHPILVIESDDWGAGPLAQADALRDIAGVLGRHRDAAGRTPVFDLALILAVPDGPAIGSGAGYRRVCLDAPVFGPILLALHDGRDSGVFALQLHGMEHYWPGAVMCSGNARVEGWLHQAGPAATEQLPSHLQSRWVDASRLPSTPHAAEAARIAVAEEVEAYTRIVGSPPRVVVPPTFVWTRETERAWAGQGVEYIVTPGWRYTRRDAAGLPAGDEGPIVNGDQTGGVTYLVRTDYFEPARGRDAAHALRALDRAVAQGRPCLLENHRDNFIGDAQVRRHAVAELDTLYREALLRHPDLRFLASWELGRALQRRDPQWLVTAPAERLRAFRARLRHSGRLGKLMALAGLAPAITVIAWLIGALPARRSIGGSG